MKKIGTNILKNHKIKGEWFDFNKIEHIIVRLQLKVPKEILFTFKEQIKLHYSRDDKKDIFDELNKINSNIYATTEYHRRIFGERSEWFYLHRASKKFDPNDEDYGIHNRARLPHIKTFKFILFWNRFLW